MAPNVQQTVNELGGSFLVAFYLPRILQWAKCQRWFPFLQEGQAKLNRVTALVLALLAAMGLHWTFSHGETGWQFSIGGPQLTVVGFLLDFARQFAAQQFFYEHQNQTSTTNAINAGADTVSPSTLGRILTDAIKNAARQVGPTLLVVTLGFGAIGCAGKQAPLVMPTSTAAIATDDAALRAYAQKSVGVLDAALDVVREVNVAEKKVEILMSPSMVTNTRAAMTAVTQQIITAAKAIQAGAKSFGALKALLDPVLAKVQALVELVHSLPASAQNRQGFGPLVSTLLGIVTTIVTGAHQ